MAFTINGFCPEQAAKKELTETYEPLEKSTAPRKSLVRVRFPQKGVALNYYNDQFDLKAGDLVYVEGKLEGQLGLVMEVSYNFKIKLSDYKKVIALVDTQVHGTFHMAGSHFVTFDPAALPAAQATTWFKAPSTEETDIVLCTDDFSFRLDDLTGMQITPAIAERGHEYYAQNRVRYICLDGTHGYAIVEGSEVYTVEFQYHNGEISHLVCDCSCSCSCKHEFAAMLQLQETLDLIGMYNQDSFLHSGYFAAITKGDLFRFAIDGKRSGSFTL